MIPANAHPIILDAATSADPSPFALNMALRDAGIPRSQLRAAELTDRQLYVLDLTASDASRTTRLDVLAETLI